MHYDRTDNRRIIAAEWTAAEHAAELDHAEHAAPFEAIAESCCGCVVCCCQDCHDHYASARVREARDARLRRERAAERRARNARPWQTVIAMGVGVACCDCARPLSRTEIDHEHRRCAACAVEHAQREQLCMHGCGRPAEPIVTRSEVFPGVECEECRRWADEADPVGARWAD